MKIEISTTEKTIKILEDISANELMEFMNSIKNIEEYKIIQTKEYIYIPQPVYYQQTPYYPYPSYPIYSSTTNTATTNTGGTFISNIRYNND
jgi:hypothetical protein